MPEGTGQRGGSPLTLCPRCGAEDHVEAVRKLQNSTKLLQKVTHPRAGGEGSGCACTGALETQCWASADVRFIEADGGEKVE